MVLFQGWCSVRSRAHVRTAGKRAEAARGWAWRCGIEQVFPCSQVGVNQRAGRAGRTGPGTCYRLFTEAAFRHEMLASAVPEIQVRHERCKRRTVVVAAAAASGAAYAGEA
jgi:hypothetical protein